jgi:hypothetical protein
MSSTVRVYTALLLSIVLAWLWLRAPFISALSRGPNWSGLLAVSSVYMCAHLLRMIRLALLTLDERSKVFSLMSAHALTAFPSSFVPFKLGEVLRLAGFLHVYNGRRKALAVWLAERFGDVLVLTGLIISMYLFKFSIPHAMRVVFPLLVLATLLGLVAIFSMARISVYLNRHLVLTSHSGRGLKLLRFSHWMRGLEKEIHKTVESRLPAVLLLSTLIWAFEIFALSLFARQLSQDEPDFAGLFTSALLASLPGGTVTDAPTFGLYQSLALIVLAIIFLIGVEVAGRISVYRIK